MWNSEKYFGNSGKTDYSVCNYGSPITFMGRIWRPSLDSTITRMWSLSPWKFTQSTRPCLLSYSNDKVWNNLWHVFCFSMLWCCFQVVLLLVAVIVTTLVVIIPCWVRQRGRKLLSHLRKPDKDGQLPVTVGLFHPYCNAGGGGERVLWVAIRALQQRWEDISDQGLHFYEPGSWISLN